MQSAATQSIASPEDYAECRRVMFGASKNYSFASRFLPRDCIAPRGGALRADARGR